jgi:hypothetical protein
VEDEWQMNDDLVADVSTDEILAEHDSANITILLLLSCTIMMNNAKSKRESKRKIVTQIYVIRQYTYVHKRV